jgi:hypothetical protein
MASMDLKKFNSDSFSKLDVHLDPTHRVKNQHSNTDINKELAYLNYQFDCENFDEVSARLKNRTSEVDKILPPGNIRRDRVIAVGYITYCPKELESQQEKFFQFSNEWLKNRLGEKNVHGSFVHLDEKHEYLKNGEICESLYHMHTIVSPYVEGKGINGKEYMTRQFLRELHRDFDNAVYKEFGIRYLKSQKDEWIDTVRELKDRSLHEQAEMVKEIRSGREELEKEKQHIAFEKEGIELERGNVLADQEAVFRRRQELDQQFRDQEEELSKREAELAEQRAKFEEEARLFAEQNVAFADKQRLAHEENRRRKLERKVKYYEERHPELKEEYKERHHAPEAEKQKDKKEQKISRGFRIGGTL